MELLAMNTMNYVGSTHDVTKEGWNKKEQLMYDLEGAKEIQINCTIHGMHSPQLKVMVSHQLKKIKENNNAIQY